MSFMINIFQYSHAEILYPMVKDMTTLLSSLFLKKTAIGIFLSPTFSMENSDVNFKMLFLSHQICSKMPINLASNFTNKL